MRLRQLKSYRKSRIIRNKALSFSLPLVLALAALLLLAAPVQSQHTFMIEGSLSRYAPGVMPRVNEWRHDNGIPGGFNPYQDYDGYLALESCQDVGKVATAYLIIDRVQSGPYTFYISDCTESPHTIEWMQRNRIAGELDYEAWQRFGIVDGRGAWLQILAID